MVFGWDGRGQLYLEWRQAGGWKRAWVQNKAGTEKDWAGSGRYLNVVRCNKPGRPGGNPTDFPIFNDLPEEQLLISFVYAASSITGLALPPVSVALAAYQAALSGRPVK